MSDHVQMPALGESVTEGTITRWLKSEGDQVEVDEPLLEVSTDKVDTEIPSPYAGVLEKIRSEEHTSELQSRPHLVCRLLLEKKKFLVSYTHPTAAGVHAGRH